jgi:type VI protein secretion system component VasA
VYHWLLALVERHGSMAEAMAQDLMAAALRRHLHEQLEQGNTGEPLDTETVMQRVRERAQARGKAQATEREQQWRGTTPMSKNHRNSPPVVKLVGQVGGAVGW